jgi:hypothetical protein
MPDERFEAVIQKELVFALAFHQRTIEAFPDRSIGEFDHAKFRDQVFSYPPREWWQKKVSLKTCRHKLGLNDTTILPHWLEQANKFLAWYRDGDEIWEFCSPAETWEKLRGRAGFVLVVSGIGLVHIGTLMN